MLPDLVFLDHVNHVQESTQHMFLVLNLEKFFLCWSRLTWGGFGDWMNIGHLRSDIVVHVSFRKSNPYYYFLSNFLINFIIGYLARRRNIHALHRKSILYMPDTVDLSIYPSFMLKNTRILRVGSMNDHAVRSFA